MGGQSSASEDKTDTKTDTEAETAKKPLELMDLPPEIHNYLIKVADGFVNLKLRATSRYFRSIIPLTPDLLSSAEQSPSASQRAVLACFDCNRLRSVSHFDDGQRDNGCGKCTSPCTHRFCINCGEHGQYKAGEVLSILGLKYVHQCICGWPGLQHAASGIFIEAPHVRCALCAAADRINNRNRYLHAEMSVTDPTMMAVQFYGHTWTIPIRDRQVFVDGLLDSLRSVFGLQAQ